VKRQILFFSAVLFMLILSGCSFLGYFGYEKQDIGRIDVYFCSESNCSNIIANEITQSQNFVHCAFYDLNLNDVENALEDKSQMAEVKLVTDNDNPSTLQFSKTDNRNGLMHNKFCVLDGKKVITGSFNPTTGSLDDENNLLVIESKKLAQNYEDEFAEFENDIFGKGNRVRNPVVQINDSKVENYFCPEDWCTDKVLKAVSLANKSIHFMIFSFTDDSIGDLFVKKHNEGIEVSGALDNLQNKNSNYSEYKRLLSAGINVSLYGNSKIFLHNKVIIIDSEIVITGSYNPTSNGDRVNDENLLIIYDEDIASKYELKFEELTKSAK